MSRRVIPANTKASEAQKRAAKKRPQTWKPGKSANPAGAPKRGQSWAELIKEYGELTPGEAAQKSLELSKQLLSIGDGVTLKQAVVLRVYGSLLFEPQPGLLNAFMDRAEGKVPDKLLVGDWRAVVQQAGADAQQLLDDVVEHVTPKLLTAPDTLPLEAAPQEAAIDDATQLADPH